MMMSSFEANAVSVQNVRASRQLCVFRAARRRRRPTSAHNTHVAFRMKSPADTLLTCASAFPPQKALLLTKLGGGQQ